MGAQHSQKKLRQEPYRLSMALRPNDIGDPRTGLSGPSGHPNRHGSLVQAGVNVT